MHSYYAKIPASQVQRQFDGNDYGMTCYALGEQGANELHTVETPRMMRIAFITNREAYILLGRRGDAIALVCALPADIVDSHMP